MIKMTPNTSWHNYFIGMSILVAKKSKDRSTHVGCVIVGEDNEVLSTGFNGFPRGVDDDIEARHDRPAKYEFTEHAERNAIFNAARVGAKLKGSTLYLNYAAPCMCTGCARAIIQAGIKTIITPNNIPWPGVGDQWSLSIQQAEEMLDEAGVGVYNVHYNSDEEQS